MTNDREYMRSYMRRYRKRQALLDGKVKNSNRGRSRTIERVMRPMLAIAELPGWPTKAQLMARR